jgi:hypothetical protein
MNFQDITTLNSYSGGTFTIPAQLPGNFGAVGYPILHFAGGTSLAHTWEFIPNTVPLMINPDSDSGTYTLEGVDPPVTGDRTAVRGTISYPGGGVETQFVDWDPAGSTAPAIDFGVLPQMTGVGISGSGPYLEASWNNTPETGLLALDFCSGPTVLYRIIIGSDLVALPDDNVVLLPVPPDVHSLDVKLTRVSCPGISIDGWDASAIWTDFTSFAQSAAKHLSTFPSAQP